MRSGMELWGNGEVRPGGWGDGDGVNSVIVPWGVVERVCIMSMCEEV